MKLLYPVSKTHMAFLFAVDEMYEKWPNSIYMWTFTFVKYEPDWRAMMRWDELKKHLFGSYFGDPHKVEFPLVQGLRVVEVHPGSNFHGLSHGLHFHCLLNRRVSAHIVRRIARKYGFGRIQAKRVSQEEANYLAKYLTKGQPELTKGARRWGTINWPEACKVRDIKIESTFHSNMREVQKALKQQKLSADIVHSIFVNSRMHGDFKDWPIDKYYYSNRSEEWLNEDRLNGCRSEWATHKKNKKLLRSNKQTREKSMQKQAQIWKEKAHRISIGFEACVMEDLQKRQQERAERSEAKKFGIYASPRGMPGDSLVKEQDGTLSYYVDEWDKKPQRSLGTAHA